MDKACLRKRMLELRSRMAPDARKKKEEALYEVLFNSSAWKNAPAIAVFVSYKDELNTRPIIERAWLEGKEIVTPKVRNLKNREMDFIKIRSWEDVGEGYKGILEPISDQAATVTPETLVLLPGLAFDRHGWRLGYGGGFYDAFLGKMEKRPPCIGLCFSEQIVEEVPHEQFDASIDKICSEIGLETVS